MYKPEQIELLKSRSESFPSEYDLQWGYYMQERSSFTQSQIDRATSIPYSLEPDYEVLCSLGCDPGFTSGHSGAFGITIVQKSDGTALSL